MRGTEFIRNLSDRPLDEREKAILGAVRRREFVPIVWSEISVPWRGHSGILRVSADALRVGEAGDAVRVGVTHRTAQLIADEVGALLPTAALSDRIWLNAARQIRPRTQPSDPADRLAQGYSPSMDDVDAMIVHSQDVDAQVTDLPDAAIRAPVGKDWVTTIKLWSSLTKAANYGWQIDGGRYAAVTAGVRVLQPVGLAHNLAHSDYSQVVRLIHPEMTVDGTSMLVSDVARDVDLWGLVSSEGPLRAMRHPGIALGSWPEPVARPAVTLPPLFSRVLRRGSVGDDVAYWQRVVGAKPDGIFGAKTDALTRDWQAKHSPLTADGVVGPKTWSKHLEEIQVRPMPDEIPFVQAVNYRVASRTPQLVRLGIVHTMEHPEKPTAAEGVANWLGGKSGPAPMASTHACADNDSIVGCVHLKDIAFGAPGGNLDGYHWEHAGYARQTPAEWMDEYSIAMLRNTALHAARVAKECGWPIRRLSVEEVRDTKSRGFCGHVDITKAFGKSTHVDPGSHFPWDYWLSMVRAAA